MTGPTKKFWTNASTILLLVRDTAASLNDIANECGIAWITTRDHARMLVDLGLLTMDGSKAEAWKLTPAGQAAVKHLRLGHERRILTVARLDEMMYTN